MKTLTDSQLIRLCAEMDGHLWLAKPTNAWPKLCIYFGYPPEGGLSQQLDRMGDSRLATKEEVTLAICANDYEDHTLGNKYLTSYDAIIPLIVKWCGDDAVYKGRFIGCLFQVLGKSCELPIGSLTAFALIKATPRQLTIALLLAVGKI